MVKVFLKFSSTYSISDGIKHSYQVMHVLPNEVNDLSFSGVLILGEVLKSGVEPGENTGLQF